MRSMTIAVVVVWVLFVSCSGGVQSPVEPSSGGDVSPQSFSADTNRYLWGAWHCYMEPDSGRIEAVPLRSLCLTANVNNLLEAKPGNLLIQDLDLTDFATEGRLDCTITLKHPLPGSGMYHGFDVWGVFMHNGASALSYDGLTYSGGPSAGVNEAVLLNADGFARWFNQPEFDGTGLPILKYWPGRLSNLPFPTAMLNGYRIFADGLGFEDDYYTWITTPGNADDRGIFRAGQANSRRYELDFPIIGGKPVVDFQYAVIAGWEPGDPALTGSPSVYDPDDFPTSANCEEAFFLRVGTEDSELYNDGQGNYGGAFRADVEVFDWQGGSVGGLGVPNEVESMIIEGDFVPGGTHRFTQAELATVAAPGTENSSVFQVEILDCAPQASGEAGLWVIVESAGLSGGTYYQGYPTKYPNLARRAAFLPGTVTVSGESPVHDIYVDDSNTSGIEDGSMAHPYNTIQEGVDAAQAGYSVLVDDSGNPYEEQVDMKSGIIVQSVNWDESDGGNRAFIDGPEDPEMHSVYFDNVTDATLEGFRIGYAGPWTFPWPFFDCTEPIRIEGGSNIGISDCLFTGPTDRTTVHIIVVHQADGVEIANCRMDAIDRDTLETACAFFQGVYADSCPGLIVRNCVFTDIRSSEDETSKGIEIVYIVNSMNVVVKNNLIHHVVPHAGVGSMGGVLMDGFHIEGCLNAEVANNVVDTFDSSDAFSINQAFAYVFEGGSVSLFTNNIASSIYSSGFPQPLARGVSGTSGCTVICDFTDTYDIGPGSNGTNYYGSASPGVGAISLNPQYINPGNEEYDISPGSPARQGDPDFVDWDDTGSPSGDPGNPDENTRSRMGCHGGPGGEHVGLLT